MTATYFKDDDPQDGSLVYYGYSESDPATLTSESHVGRWDGSFGLIISVDLQLNDFVGKPTACWAYADGITLTPAQFI